MISTNKSRIVLEEMEKQYKAVVEISGHFFCWFFFINAAAKVTLNRNYRNVFILITLTELIKIFLDS